VSIVDTTGVVTLRQIPKENDLTPFNTVKTVGYGACADLSAWTVAGSAVLFVHEQTIPVESLYRAKA
jgi:hypothetical protein